MNRKALWALVILCLACSMYYFMQQESPEQKSFNCHFKQPIQSKTHPPKYKGEYALIRLGTPKYPKNFKHFDYTNPNAPKGGALVLGAVGSFDKVNAVTLRGRAAEGLDLTKDNLMMPSRDEHNTKYSFIAHSYTTDPTVPSMTLHLRTDVFFYDGTPLTAYDIKSTIEKLIEDGVPAYRNYYRRIKNIIIPDPHTITFEFDQVDYSPLLLSVIANIAPISKEQKDIDNHIPLLRTGPYCIESFEPGKTIVYKRNPYYWAKDLPITQGMYNFDTIQIDYYKDDVALVEAFKKGLFDMWFCSNPNQFFNFKCTSSNFKKLVFTQNKPVAVQAAVFNMTKPTLQDVRVRKALCIMFNFDKINQLYFGGHLKQASSLFENTNMAHKGTATGKERDILQGFKSKIDINDMLNNTPFKGDRKAIASKLLDEAGFKFRGNSKIRSNNKGEKLVFKLIIRKRRLEKVFNLFKKDLESVGVCLNVFCLEESLFRQAEDKRAYDMMMYTWQHSAQPSIELLSYFGKKTGVQPGTGNVMCLVDDIAEELARGVVDAQNLGGLTTAARAFDRYIMHQYYQIPFDYTDKLYVVYRQDRIDFTKDPNAGIDVMSLGWSVK